MAVPLTPLLLVAHPTNVGRRCQGGGGGDGLEQYPHGAAMPTMEIHLRINFPRWKSGGGNNSNVVVAAALADAETVDSGDCAICKGGRFGGGVGKHHDTHCVCSMLLRCIWKHIMSVWNSFFAFEQISPSGVIFLQSTLHTRPLVLTKVVTDAFLVGSS